MMSLLLVLALLLQTGAFAFNHDDFAFDAVTYLPVELSIPEQSESNGAYEGLAERFDIYYAPGVSHDGYLFRLVEDAVISRDEDGIKRCEYASDPRLTGTRQHQNQRWLHPFESWLKAESP